jgi:hypothetical protein
LPRLPVLCDTVGLGIERLSLQCDVLDEVRGENVRVLPVNVRLRSPNATVACVRLAEVAASRLASSVCVAQARAVVPRNAGARYQLVAILVRREGQERLFLAAQICPGAAKVNLLLFILCHLFLHLLTVLPHSQHHYAA